MNFLVTAGPTREPIDPVRFISNPSTGKMGYAIAAAAHRMGHAVRLVSGPTSLPAPDGVQTTRVTTADEMLKAVMDSFEWCNALIMAAAVCDWKPETCSPRKLKKDRTPPSLALARTPDILLQVSERKGGRILIGFAAETGELEAEARRKLVAKNLDLVVANDVSRADAGFATDTNAGLLVSTDTTVEIPVMGKDELAGRIVEWAAQRYS